MGPTGPVGATGPWPAGPTGLTGATGPTGSVGPPPRSFPESKAERVASTIALGVGRLVEFRSHCNLTQVNGNLLLEGNISIYLVENNLEALLSSVSSLSPNSRASSIPWLASTIETRLKALGVEVSLDMDVLEEASKRALSLSFERTFSAVATVLVERVDHTRAQELWAEAIARYVMES